ncbi:MAG: esterase-like activity of phytase family protein [Blastocatellia bacterium]
MNKLRGLLPPGLVVGLLLAALTLSLSLTGRVHSARQAEQKQSREESYFNRVASFKVRGAEAEIIAGTPDGRTLVYTDAPGGQVGFVDIGDPARPVETATLKVAGTPTSAAITPDGHYALVCVDGAPDQLVVFNVGDRTVAATHTLPGQPDSVAISPDGRYAAIAIENERDESLNGGRMPQLPAGLLVIVDLTGAPARWTRREVALTGLAERFPSDPEPEFVAINRRNEAAVTLQENNHIVIVNLPNGRVLSHWPAGVTTHAADTVNDNDARFTDQISGRREPDAIAWTPAGNLITANEGDYTVDLATGEFAGGRDFTVFSRNGEVLYEPGATLELEAVKHSHYPDARSRSKGCEFEGVAIARYFRDVFAFVGSERGNFVAVYKMDDERAPRFHQLLPTGVSPEGLLTIPHRGLFLSANEVEGSISIFALEQSGKGPDYPDVVSDGITWSALSGLANGPGGTLYAVPDQALRPSRVFTLRPGDPAKIESVTYLNGNYDPEGIAVNPAGGWWIVSEGAGNAPAATTKNLLLHVNADGSVARAVELPPEVNAQQRQFGFEGVATSADGSQVYVAFQREWGDDLIGFVKIGRYTPATGAWAFFRYQLDALRNPPAGAWVGLSEITRIDDTTFAVLERDNQLAAAAQIKRIYTFSIAGLNPVPAGQTPPLAPKQLVRDLLVQDRFLLEKAEGMVYSDLGDYLVVNDNDGLGETRVFYILNPDYDIILQDDHSGDVLRFSSRTGAWVFIPCGGNSPVKEGIGRVTRAGCAIRLRGANIDAVYRQCAPNMRATGSASIRDGGFLSGRRIEDRNAADNAGLCR